MVMFEDSKRAACSGVCISGGVPFTSEELLGPCPGSTYVCTFAEPNIEVMYSIRMDNGKFLVAGMGIAAWLVVRMAELQHKS
jgi:hypothetical protein